MSYRSFAVIIYVTEIERQAVMRMYDWSDLTIEGDHQAYKEAFVAYAATHAMNPKPHVIIAKSVCDFADEKKDDMYQQFAAYTSCGLIKDLMEKVLEYTCM